MKISVFNLGCKVNQYECDVIAEKLTFSGHDVIDKLEFADVYILNTCAVTSEAERKSRQAVARCLALNGKARIFVLGCASQKSPSSFEKEGVVYISGTSNKLDIIDKINNQALYKDNLFLENNYEELTLTFPHRTRTYVKIQDGCNNFCSYCIIPYLRGRSRSREIGSVINEVKLLAQQTKEIVLTGIDIMAFGKDTGSSLTELLRALSGVDVRIRLGSVYAEKIDRELLDAMFSLKDFCPHFHLSLQSGDNKVLKSMNRHYTAEEYLNKIRLIREYDKLCGITTDIIVGFPTEGEYEFNNTRQFLQEAQFSDLHIFPYSSRSGTVAASRYKPLPKDVIVVRKQILAKDKKELHKNFLSKNLYIKQKVLIEEQEDGYNVGYSKNYIRIYSKKDGELIDCVPDTIYKNGLKEL